LRQGSEATTTGLTAGIVPYTFFMDKEGTIIMQAIENIDVSLATPVLVVAESANPEADVHHMRALRRKARRISAFARLNVSALNALAVQVESDIAALQH
jgi:hypothetical protein